MVKVDVKELSKEMDDIPNWNNTLYKTDDKGFRLQKINFKNEGTWRVVYNDGSHVDGPKGYRELKRKGVKSISVIDGKGKPIHTVQVKDDTFIIRNIALVRQIVQGGNDIETEAKRIQDIGFNNEKRCYLLATPGEHDYIWDDGDIDELTEWGDHSPYTKEKVGVLVKGEKFW